MKSLIVVSAMALALAACAGTSSPATAAKTEVNKANAIAGLNAAFVDRDVNAVDRYFADPYIQHNPIGSSGVASFKGLVGSLPGPVEMETHRVLGDGDLVAMHTTYANFGPEPLVGFDVFRFDQNGKIVEHWDNLTPVTPPNPSGRTQTDGATGIVDLDKTEANRAVVENFISDVLIAHTEPDVTKYISPVTYLQHNSNVADGLEGFGAAMKAMEAQGIKMIYETLHFTVAEGNFVLAASEGEFAGKRVAFYDLFRLDNGLIVEHWDVIADLPGADVPAGYPGKF